MSPQLTIQQLEHAIAVFEKRVEAKKLEIESIATFRDDGWAALLALCSVKDKVSLDMLPPMETVEKAAQAFFSAKHTQASFDLEELELTVKALRHQRSGIVGAGMIMPPFNSKRQ